MISKILRRTGTLLLMPCFLGNGFAQVHPSFALPQQITATTGIPFTQEALNLPSEHVRGNPVEGENYSLFRQENFARGLPARSGSGLARANEIHPYLLDQFTSHPFEVIALKLGWNNVMAIVHDLDLRWLDEQFRSAVAEPIWEMSAPLIPTSWLDLRRYLRVLAVFVAAESAPGHEELQKLIADAVIILENVPGSLLPMSSGLPSTFLLSQMLKSDNADLSTLVVKPVPENLLMISQKPVDEGLRKVLKDVWSSVMTRLANGRNNDDEAVSRITAYAGDFADTTQSLFFLILANRWLKHADSKSTPNPGILSKLICTGIFSILGFALMLRMGFPLITGLPIDVVIALLLTFLTDGWKEGNYRAADWQRLEHGFSMIHSLAEHLPSKFIHVERLGIIQLERLSEEWQKAKDHRSFSHWMSDPRTCRIFYITGASPGHLLHLDSESSVNIDTPLHSA